MGYSSDFKTDDTFWDKGEEFPGFIIIQREIKKAVSGESFFYNDIETGKPVRLKGIEYSEFLHYYKIWENFHYFGLPGGKGWLSERGWLLEFLKIFEKSYSQIEMFIEQKAHRG